MITIEGTVTEVMETWPLQLNVASGIRTYAVTLTEGTQVRRRGIACDPGTLRPGQQVDIQGHSQSAWALVADLISIRG